MSQANGVGWFRMALWRGGGLWAPLLCLAVELGTRMCRDMLFDPVPTWWHVLLVLTVPAATVLGLCALERPERTTRGLGILLGCAICTSLLYGVPFLLLLPLSIMTIPIAGVGLLGMVPIAAPIAMVSLAAEFYVRAGDPGGRKLRGIWTGFLGCIVFLALIDIGPVRTILRVREQQANSSDGEGAEWLRDHGDRGMLEELAMGKAGLRPLAFFFRRNARIAPQFVRDHWMEFTGEAPPPSLQARWND